MASSHLPALLLLVAAAAAAAYHHSTPASTHIPLHHSPPLTVTATTHSDTAPKKRQIHDEPEAGETQLVPYHATRVEWFPSEVTAAPPFDEPAATTTTFGSATRTTLRPALPLPLRVGSAESVAWRGDHELAVVLTSLGTTRWGQQQRASPTRRRSRGGLGQSPSSPPPTSSCVPLVPGVRAATSYWSTWPWATSPTPTSPGCLPSESRRLPSACASISPPRAPHSPSAKSAGTQFFFILRYWPKFPIFPFYL
ncbi:hypothetical protein PVAP13_9NG295073 [Panicum virgatum]|uniref:Uncharacterized protein n=1 Tax=Panicum virgatum TaxID=38727 RepID=A0A8T0MRN4_PANVG|nr:hypothetical protein PVAP13_9NG295073 [Panicum virgatum]